MIPQEFIPWKTFPDEYKQILKIEALLDWALGFLPWSFRRPILAALAAHHRTHPINEDIYRAVRDALNFAWFPINEDLDQSCIEDLIAFYRKQGATQLEITAKEAFTHRQKDERNDSAKQLDAFLRAHLLLLVSQDFLSLVPTGSTDYELTGTLNVLLKQFTPSGEIIPVRNAKNTKYRPDLFEKPDLPDHPVVRIFYFWRWQYVQRNKGYATLRNKAERILQEKAVRDSILAFDFNEYFMLPPLQIRSHIAHAISIREGHEPSWLENQFLCLNHLTEECKNKYKMLVTWPLEDYGADVILERIVDNVFNYRERPTPPSRLINDPPTISPKNQVKFNKVWKEYAVVRDEIFKPGAAEDPLYSENLTKYYSLQRDYGQITSNEVVPRIYNGTESRAIGIWLWDYVNANGCTGADATAALAERYPFLKDRGNNDFLRCLRTATTSIERAEYFSINKNMPPKRGRPSKKRKRKKRLKR